MSKWLPIESAPKGERIDVWVRSFELGAGGKVNVTDVGRKTDVFWGCEYYHEGVGEDRKMKENGEGWVETDWAYTGGTNLIERGSHRITHWMPLPEAPTP